MDFLDPQGPLSNADDPPLRPSVTRQAFALLMETQHILQVDRTINDSLLEVILIPHYGTFYIREAWLADVPNLDPFVKKFLVDLASFREREMERERERDLEWERDLEREREREWERERQRQAFFSNAPNGTPNPVHANANKLFDKYRDDPKNDPDEINIEGTSKMLGEMTIGVEDISSFIFSELVQSPTLGKITREGFVDGCLETSSDTLPKIRNVVIQRRSQLSTNPDIFRNVYNHAFVLGLANNQKSLSQEVATEFWQLFFSPQGFAWHTNTSPWLTWWLEFQENKWNKAVNKDLWRQTLTFAEQTMKDETLGFWTEESSWPSVIDEFVEWVKTEKRGGGGEEAMDVA